MCQKIWIANQAISSLLKLESGKKRTQPPSHVHYKQLRCSRFLLHDGSLHGFWSMMDKKTHIHLFIAGMLSFLYVWLECRWTDPGLEPICEVGSWFANQAKCPTNTHSNTHTNKQTLNQPTKQPYIKHEWSPQSSQGEQSVLRRQWQLASWRTYLLIHPCFLFI